MYEEKVLEQIIMAYRKVVDSRYDYDTIVGQYAIPSTFTRNKFEALRLFFLEYIYPPPEKRALLDDAFESLEGHIANPRYLLSILMDSVGILFKYGRHLPKILRTGLKAMQSFKKASDFEAQLAKAAIRSNRKAPFSKSDIEYFTGLLSRKDVNDFIEDSLSLFETLHDRELVKQIIDIVKHIINKMKLRPSVYAQKEIMGLELGRDLIVNGDKLFESLTKQEQDLLFKMVVKIERDTLKRIFN